MTANSLGKLIGHGHSPQNAKLPAGPFTSRHYQKVLLHVVDIIDEASQTVFASLTFSQAAEAEAMARTFIAVLECMDIHANLPF